MILSFDEMNPNWGNVPFNDGQVWRSRPTFVYSQATDVQLTAAADASIISAAGGQPGQPTLPSGALNALGRTLRIRIGGYATTGATAGTIKLYLKLGPTIVATTAAITPVASQSGIGFFADILATTKGTNTAGNTGSIDAFGVWHLGALCATIAPSIQNGSAAGTQAPATPGAVDQTAALPLDIRYVPSNALHTFTFTNINVELIF